MNDMSDIMKMFGDKLGNDPSQLASILTMFQGTSNSSSENNTYKENTTSSDTSSFEMPDLDTIMKIKKVMDSMKSNANDPRANLLLSLKPYLHEPKKSKVDQYVRILGMTNAFSMFSDQDGDKK